jgi:hypothetical protein
MTSFDGKTPEHFSNSHGHKVLALDASYFDTIVLDTEGQMWLPVSRCDFKKLLLSSNSCKAVTLIKGLGLDQRSTHWRMGHSLNPACG